MVQLQGCKGGVGGRKTRTVHIEKDIHVNRYRQLQKKNTIFMVCQSMCAVSFDSK